MAEDRRTEMITDQADPAPSPDSSGAAPPQASADGRWWWTGSMWVPMPQQPRQQADNRMPGQSLPTPVLMLAAAGLTVLGFMLFALIVSGA